MEKGRKEVKFLFVFAASCFMDTGPSLDQKTPWSTPMKLLFVCSQNRLRSPTAEAVFSVCPGMEAMSAGTNHDAETPLSADLIEWADIVFVMEKSHRNRLTRKFKAVLKAKRLVVLDIPDEYEYMDPELIAILKTKVPRHVRMSQTNI